jgi:hypothetical protein
MTISALFQRWGLFAATVFLLLGVTLAYLNAGPVAGHGVVIRYAFWMATAAAAFLAWWLSQWWVVSGRDRLTRRLLLVSCLLATLLFVPASLSIDVLFSLTETEPFGFRQIVEEWAVSALPVFSACMIASLPAWLSMSEPAPLVRAPAPAPVAQPVVEAVKDPARDPSVAVPVTPASAIPAEPSVGTQDVSRNMPSEPPESGLLPVAVRGGVLRATADLQYVHLHSPEGMTTVPGPMHRVIALLGDQGLEVRRGEWIADRHVKQVKSVRGRWVVLLKDGQQVTVSRRRLAEVKERWGSTRYT